MVFQQTYTSQAQEYAIPLKEKTNKTVFKYLQKKKKGNRKVLNLNPVPKGGVKRKKSNSMNAAFIMNDQKFYQANLTEIFPHLNNITKVLHYKIGQNKSV